MATLSIYLPPFSPDYSGVASALFALPCITVLHDASGCTGNYTGYDEPRWYGSQSPIFCSGLREIDAVLGDDEKLINKVIEAQKSIQAQMVAIIGSPVPMIVGCDYNGIAREITAETGLPAFGFDTTGTQYYDKGIALACNTLLTHFSQESKEVKPLRINLLGLNAIDFAQGNTSTDLLELLQAKGYEIGVVMPYALTIEGMKHIAEASVNLVVSTSGIETAKLLQATYGTPYFVGLPYGKEATEHFFHQLEQVRVHKVSNHFHTFSTAAEKTSCLIVGEQVASNALRSALQDKNPTFSIEVGTLFGLNKELAEPKDRNLATEWEIIQTVNNPQYNLIVADPLLCKLIRKPEIKHIPLAHYGVSSKHVIDHPSLIDQGFDHWWALLKEQITI